MPVPSWLRPLAARLTPARRGRPKSAPRRASFRPRLEGLEDRAVPAIFVVVNTADTTDTADPSYVGSLRWAITEANNTPNVGGPDLIAFAIPGAGVHTIQPLSALPAVTDPVIIDG